MPLAPVPTTLRHLGGRRFSFYPPIRQIEHNEWLYRRETWTECIVENLRTREEVCIPRMFLGEVSIVDDPVVIVGLTRELEWRAGAVTPHIRHVIELPIAVNDSRPVSPRPARPAPVINIRLEPEPSPARRIGKWIGAAVLLGTVAVSIVAGIVQSRATQLTSSDDLASVTAKLGHPTGERTGIVNGRYYRVLSYPNRRLSVVLSGDSPGSLRFAGTIASGNARN